MTNKVLNGNLPKLSTKIRQRRTRFAGHFYRSKDEPVSSIVLWTPKHGSRKPGRPAITYTDILKMDTGLESPYFKSAMGDRKAWGTIVIGGHHST